MPTLQRILGTDAVPFPSIPKGHAGRDGAKGRKKERKKPPNTDKILFFSSRSLQRNLFNFNSALRPELFSAGSHCEAATRVQSPNIHPTPPDLQTPSPCAEVLADWLPADTRQAAAGGVSLGYVARAPQVVATQAGVDSERASGRTHTSTNAPTQARSRVQQK